MPFESLLKLCGDLWEQSIHLVRKHPATTCEQQHSWDWGVGQTFKGVVDPGGWVGGSGPTNQPPPWGADFLRGAKQNFCCNLESQHEEKKRSPANNNCNTEFHNGRSNPFSKTAQGKRAAALAMACKGISLKRCERAAVPCMQLHGPITPKGPNQKSFGPIFWVWVGGGGGA